MRWLSQQHHRVEDGAASGAENVTWAETTTLALAVTLIIGVLFYPPDDMLVSFYMLGISLLAVALVVFNIWI